MISLDINSLGFADLIADAAFYCARGSVGKYRLQVLAIERPRYKTVSTNRMIDALREVQEMIWLLREGAHFSGRHIEQMFAASCSISEPQSYLLLLFDQDDLAII